MTQPSPSRRPSLFRPLREKAYRTIWGASLLSNFGQLIQGVGAAWEMTRLTASAEKVALVQTAIMLPLMLLALPSGAIADMFDRRKVALTGLAFASASAIGLTACALLGLVSVWVLLGFTFLIGAGVALFGPAWQSSVSEQVGPELVPSAVALGSISYNVARSFGPAIGGLVVASAGAVAAFGLNALLYLPAMLAFYFWRREVRPSRLPPERIDRAIVAGMRYALHSPPIRIVLLRTLVSGLAGASVMALTPLVAKQLLAGGPATYGLLLGSFGAGAVAGALFLDRVREKLAGETAVRLLAILVGALILFVGTSRILWLTMLAMLACGAVWTQLVTLFNIGVQLSAPRWVTARALACFATAITGGIAVGSWIWGSLAARLGVGPALQISGATLAASALLGLRFTMPRVTEATEEMGGERQEPEVKLAITMRSGPVVIEVDYRVALDEARSFYEVMQHIRRSRMRSGAFEWSLARDIADPELWTERYHCPTWGDYLRQRNRATQRDLEIEAQSQAFHHGSTENRVRRRLERPLGSVRWRAETPDPGPGQEDFSPYPP